ncbi:MAG: heme o synthase [Candidatus Kapabacteria bacterium]|jgi:protoheme IX farnesyltransferase|nr:heme o synthase [Candidatus Kapabacteria bacterium]
METVQTNLTLVTDTASEKQASKVGFMSTFAAYYEMTKPGITRMVVLSAAAGYYLGVSKATEHFSDAVNVINFLLAMLGTALVSSGSCVLNNFMERDFDKLMKRTMQRPIPAGAVSPKAALFFGLALGAAGIAALSLVNLLTVGLAILTFVLYVNIYTPLKRKTTLSLIVGGFPGAFPALGGWTAATDSIGLGGFMFFLLMFFWQMPHFLALSWMYKQDYERGGYEMLAVHDQTGKNLAWQTVGYILLLIPSTLALTFVRETGMVYLVGASLLCAVFLYFSIQLLRHVSVVNARKVLLSSYLYLVGIFILIFVDKV